MIKNLGQVAAIYVGKTAPRNANMIWLDNTVIPYVFKSYNGEEWTEIPTGAWIEAYVNGWLVSLQQGTVTTDDDYMLINSGGMNYKMTVRDFVKSSVGNPLDFKGVIRTDSDFPNPSTLESGDMYIIITEPAGGTVTDPYSGETFSDSEKIVWDSVVKSWESLGKIDVSVDLSTTYSATGVTIHSSAGKETTVVGVTDQNAGVMLPEQKQWLDALSDGSIIPGDQAMSKPAHKHNYGDIIDRIISQQSTGSSIINPMSQKATTDALDLKLDKSSVLQVSGVSTTDVMSQKAVTDAIQTLETSVDNKFLGYLPLSGGEMTGNIILPTGTSIKGKVGNSVVNMLNITSGGQVEVGRNGGYIVLSTDNYNLRHNRAGVNYIIHDTYNLPNPVQTSDLESYATKTWVGEQGYLTNSSLTGYATETWVEGKNYLTSADLSTYATQKWVQDQNYITSSSLTGYATETWVEEKNYLVASDLNGYATESWVNSKNYLTSADLTGYATEAWVEAKNYITADDIPSVTITNSGNGNAVTAITASGHVLTVTKGATYLTSASLSGYATEKWVTDKNYLTSDSLSGYATEEWASGQFPSKTGTGASGSWAIDITGNAATSTNSTQLGGVAAESYATQQWVEGKGYITSSSLTGYATQQWVKDQEYITGADIPPIVIVNSGSGNAVTSISATGHAVTVTKGATFLTSSDLTGYATESWVEGKNYLTSSSLTGYATQTWVESKNYLTSSSLDGYAKTTDLNGYLPLSGNGIQTPITGNIVFANGVQLRWSPKNDTPETVINYDSSSNLTLGASGNLYLDFSSDLFHKKGATNYKIWDASNIAKPVNYNEGTESTVTTIYNRNLGVNGNQWTFLSYTNASTTNIYAPTTAGTSGQVLQSQGTGKAPTWVDFSGGGVQLSDDNVWTGLNTFQGGLKTSDGTNSYDVWANDILTYPVKYTSNSTGTGYALSFYSKTAGWKEIDTLTTKYLTSSTVKSINAGGDGYIGIGSNAYASAAIAEISTNRIFFKGLTSTVLSTNSDGELEYGSSTNYAGFNSGDIRIAYPIVSSSGGGSGGGGGTTDSSEGGLTIGYYPTNTKSRVTERAKIYCTTINLYLKDLTKNTQLDFDTDGLYVTTGSTSKVRLATLNDVSGGGGSSVSLDSDNTWTGTNAFKSTVQMQSEDLTDAEGTQTCGYDIQMTDLARTVNFKLEGHLDRNPIFKVGTYNFQPVSPYATLTVDGGYFTFQSDGSLTTKISGSYYEFWNKNNLAKPVTYSTNSDGDGILYKGDSTSSKIDSLELSGILPNDAVSLINGGLGGIGTDDCAYSVACIGSLHTNEIRTYTDTNMTEVVSLVMTNDGVYFNDANGKTYKLTMEVVS